MFGLNRKSNQTKPYYSGLHGLKKNDFAYVLQKNYGLWFGLVFQKL